MINKYLNLNYINNSSDIKALVNEKYIKDIINKLDKNKYIYVTSHLIHKKKKINQIEQFMFNLDNYITYIKQLVHISPLELRYIINLTLNNKYIKLFYSSLYYYDNVDEYIKIFKKIFMFNYIKNLKIISNYIHIKKRNFNEFINFINSHKKRTYCYFENITINNMNFYISIIEELENSN